MFAIETVHHSADACVRRSGAIVVDVCIWQIVLQKSKVAARRILREIMNLEAIADSYNLNRITEVACEFNVRR